MSLFALPVSRGARLARIFVVLALDLVLAGAGLAMIVSYLGERKRARDAGAAQGSHASAAVEALTPELAPREPPGAPADEPADSGGSTENHALVAAGDQRRRPTDPVTRPGPGMATAPASGPAATAPVPSGTIRTPPEPARSDEPVGEPADTPSDGPSDEPADEEVQAVQRRIALAVRRHERQLERCYEQATKAISPDDPLDGRIEIRLTVMPDGTAANVRPAGNTTGSQQLARCVAGLVESWTFAPGAAQPLDFHWPFLFKAPGRR